MNARRDDIEVQSDSAGRFREAPLEDASFESSSAKALKPDPNGTRHRLLEAAGEIFADRGFRDATVRGICEHARTNHAAVNYYFGGKEQLYWEVIEHVFQFDQAEPSFDWQPETSSQHKLSDILRWLMLECSPHGMRPPWHVRLMAREMAMPTKACAGVIESYVRTRFELLDSILTDLLPAETPREDRCLVTWLVLMQAEQSEMLRTFASLLEEGDVLADLGTRRLAEFITRFNLAALDEINRTGWDKVA